MASQVTASTFASAPRPSSAVSVPEAGRVAGALEGLSLDATSLSTQHSAATSVVGTPGALSPPAADASFDAFVRRFDSQIFGAAGNPLLYIKKHFRGAREGAGSEYLSQQHFWGSLAEGVAYQMAGEGGSSCISSRTTGPDGTQSVSVTSTHRFVGGLKVDRIDSQVTLSDTQGHQIVLQKVPTPACEKLEGALRFVPLPVVPQPEYLEELPDGRFLYITSPVYNYDYDDFAAYLGKPGDWAELQILNGSRLRDGGTTTIETDAGTFHSPSRIRANTGGSFTPAGAHAALTLTSYHDDKEARAQALGIFDPSHVKPKMPTLAI